MWMEGEDLTGTLSANDPVDTWLNTGNGGTGYDLIKIATDTTRPLYKTASGPNGLPYVESNRSSFQTLKVRTASGMLATASTLVMVINPQSLASSYDCAFLSGKNGLYLKLGGSNWGSYMEGDVDSGAALSTGTWYVLAIVMRAFNDIDFYTGLSKVTRTNGNNYHNSPLIQTIFSSGNAEQWSSVKCAMVGWDDTTYDETAMDAIINALGTKYGVSV
jgi:hypothetical protein